MVSLYAKVPYDQLRDFAPITRIGMTPNIITVHPSVPFKSIKQFIRAEDREVGQGDQDGGHQTTLRITRHPTCCC